ncbi:DUF2786 domain-containing protein [Diaphorobacter sp. LR2014-1]|uniref:DUF2786 domain-containing protein n=1 Tax=Diaphorobacter sp. LR2014-1 TaxID=1933219 RepID=UPI000D49CEB3|nr:DUF2786 domain-containing protein [Diaphorobacter sp. LR2014-1]POR07683.1 hypothetical protein BV908_19860 [Diaphorobacter sp. LR2014-1]
MQNIDPKILGKIKKCLALSSSDNPHEAAAALRQANALMAAHGVSAEHISMADIGQVQTGSRTMARNKPAHWEGALAATVGKAFGCQLMLHRNLVVGSKTKVLNDGAYIFVGIAAQAEIAAYTFDVLARKLKKTRSAWIAEQLDGMSKLRGGKRMATSLGDEFAIGWVQQIARLVQVFAQPTEVERAIARFIESRSIVRKDGEDLMRKPQLEDERLRSVAQSHGRRAAEGETIHRPIHGREQLALK